MSGMDERSYERINDYTSVEISLARAFDIRSWSHGEVKKPETINYRTYRPERDGLFCERIFGPEKDWECMCGKYRGMKYKGMICDRCGVKITHSRVRRQRMGHIELAAPVVHIWFFKTMPSRLGNLLDMKMSSLEKVIYFQDYVVTNPKDTPLKPRQLLTEGEFREATAQYGSGTFDAEMGAEAIRTLLSNLDLVTLSQELREELITTNSKQRKKELINRLKIVEAIRDSENKPEWMVLDVIPVIPPDLRPLVMLDNGNFATSDLNDLYRRIINRNNRLKKLTDLNAPEVIVRNEKRMLQQSVDALFDNGRCKRPVLGSSNRALKSLTDMIKGKQGRFRENLLGKRVDYSARSVIVVGPTLRLHQCGIPKKIVLELFQPFIIRRLKELGHADTIKSAKKMLERKDEEVWDILEEVIYNHPVLLNRAPTLHRMGIQAFEPVLVEGNAIKLHPLVCRGFNADFDGDQMAVHLPLSIEAQVEAHTLMMSTNNIFSPANGRPIISPSQDVVMGCYYMTVELTDRAGEGMAFPNFQEVYTAYQHGKVTTHTPIELRLPERYANIGIKGDSKVKVGQRFKTTVGRVLFNDTLPEGMPFYNEAMRSGSLGTVISDCYELLGRRATIDLLDDMNQMGFRESTRSGLSFATDDLITPASKKQIIDETERVVMGYMNSYQYGALTERERYARTLDAWTEANAKITREMTQALDNDHRWPGYVNPIYLMSQSGARGGIEQIRQLAGMRGLMAKPSGKIIETPIKANFREGLSVLEYFSSTHGARKGLADTALKTADSGYMTRKLADVAQNVVVTSDDCGTTQGISKGIIYRGEKVEVSLAESIKGRVSCANIVNPITDEVIVRANEMITLEGARKIEEMGLEKIMVRSPMTCESPLGVCAKCYGMDLSTGMMVEQGMAVGTIAAQSIGEPGTQLTMRTFHIGGTAARGMEQRDIKNKKDGRVRYTRLKAVTNDAGQTVSLTRQGEVSLLDERGRELEKYEVPAGAQILVEDGKEVPSGTTICRWDPHSVPILAEIDGKVRFEDLIEGETVRVEKDAVGTKRLTVVEYRGDFHPQIILEDEGGKILDIYYLSEKAHIEAEEGSTIKAGTILAKTPREVLGTQDITGGLPRVAEIFEARKPKEPAVIAEIDGMVEILGEKRRGKRTVKVIQEDTGLEREHLITPGKHLRVRSGDYVKAGEALVEGSLLPHDILRISGEEAVQQYLTREVQNVYRSQRVQINDKHIEIIVSQMLRKILVEAVGDTGLPEGALMDKHDFLARNRQLDLCVKIDEPGDSGFTMGDIVPRERVEIRNSEVEAAGGTIATFKAPQKAVGSTQLLGISKAAVQSSSFISAASFQETTKVLTEAALAGKIDRLVGLKENVILGHLIPAGTGFKTYQDAEWSRTESTYAEASILDQMMEDATDVDFTLLDDSNLLSAGINLDEHSPLDALPDPDEEVAGVSEEEAAGDEE